MAISVGTVPPISTHRFRSVTFRVIQIALSLAVATFVFRGVMPRITDYSAAWTSIKGVGWLAFAGIVAVTVVHAVLFWPQIMASLPGLTFAQAAVSNQTSTTVANTVPGGGMVAVGVTYTMYHAWGFSDAEIALSTGVTFVWNIFVKLSLPLIAFIALAIAGRATGGMLVATSAGLVVLGAAVGGLALMLWKQEVARRVSLALGSVHAAWFRLIRRRRETNWGEAGVRFRSRTIGLVRGRWRVLTLTTLASNLALFLVLLISLRAVGVSGADITWTQALGVFSVVRLLSAFPITPGGIGVVELGFIGGLVLAAGGHPGVSAAQFHTQVAAAVLIYRALTFAVPIPLGALAYLVWQRKRSWRTARPIATDAVGSSTPVERPLV